MHRIIVLAGIVLLGAPPAPAQPAEPSPALALTWEGALERARQSAPAIVAARLRIEEARGRLAGASLPFSTNPSIELEAGRRSGATSSAEYGLAVAHDLELPRRRHARIEAANAGVLQEEQRARGVERETLRDVATAFLRALESRERADAAVTGRQLAEEALQIAERRYRAGDVAQLDVNLARTAVAQAAADVRIAHATLTGRVTQLQILLGIAEPITPAGSLREMPSRPPEDLVARAADRSDLRLLDAEIAEAEAEQRLARTLRWPDFGVRASYAKEEGDRVFLGGVGLTLPIFQRGQEATAIAHARLARLRAERDALTRTIEADVRGAVATFETLRAAVAAYEQAVLPLIEENERLALESYDVGQIGLADLLLVRREALDARRSLIDQLIETRLAEVELRVKAGVWK
ncbi:MAG TPA: TolC family protein [Thermoanaerobaculia bacterium]|nr:TolC family protein [Thermoanaerobaculia bacterium]